MSAADPATLVSRRGQEATLRRLFWKLIFRSRRKSRGKVSDPKSEHVTVLAIFGFVGLVSLTWIGLGGFAFAAALHSLTFVMVGMNLAISGGSLLFNPEEAEVLLHRPIEPRVLLGAKLHVIVRFSLGMALALNLCGLAVGVGRDWNWLFLPAHLLSLTLSILFCTGSVVLLYNLCLRCFGREKLDSLMTTVQVLFGISVMVGSQIVPRYVLRMNHSLLEHPPAWFAFLPPTWFAALDTVISGKHVSGSMFGLAGLGIVSALLVTWLAVGLLGNSYEQGLLALNEAASSSAPSRAAGAALASRQSGGERLVQLPGLRSWLRDPVERAAFRLVWAGLTRARDVKLRVYPILGQFLVYPMIFVVGSAGFDEGAHLLRTFQIAFTGAYLCIIPQIVFEQLRFSDHWAAAEVFQQAPLRRAAALFHGTRKAILCLLCVPGLLLLAVVLAIWLGLHRELLLLLPGLFALPLASLLPGLGQTFIPFSEAPQANRSALGCLTQLIFLAGAMLVAGLAWWSWTGGWFAWMLPGEMVAVMAGSALLGKAIERRRMPPLE